MLLYIETWWPLVGCIYHPCATLSQINPTFRLHLRVHVRVNDIRYPERLLAYGEASGDRPTRMDKETFLWYNKFFWDISQLARKASFGDTCPMHTEYLEYGVENSIFDLEL